MIRDRRNCLVCGELRCTCSFHEEKSMALARWFGLCESCERDLRCLVGEKAETGSHDVQELDSRGTIGNQAAIAQLGRALVDIENGKAVPLSIKEKVAAFRKLALSHGKGHLTTFHKRTTLPVK